MDAIHTCILTFVKSGDHVLACDTLYGETIELITQFRDFGIEVTFADFTNLEKVKAEIQPNTKVVYSETISNPCITIVDVEEVSKFSHKNEAVFIIDDTFCTPYCIK